MQFKAFSNPQRQSKIGVLLIFIMTLYKGGRAFWGIGAYLLISDFERQTWVYIGLGVFALLILAVIYSYVYYQKFLFHIDYKKEAFVLQKGVFSTENTEIPFDKIQQVNTEQSLLQRLVNVHKLVIDTAGGKEKEASIHALSKLKANQLSTILMEAKDTSETAETDVETTFTSRKKIIWSYKMDLATLLKIGISSNYFRGLAIILAFFSTIYQEFSRWFRDSMILDEYTNQFSGLSKSISGILLLVSAFLLASILITIIEVFIKYFNLKLQQTQNQLQVEMGLKTNKKISLRPRRVQLLQTKTNPLQKKLDLHELKIALANSENALQKSKIRIPGLGKNLVEKVNAFLYEKETSSFQAIFRAHKILLFRRLIFAFVPVVVASLFWKNWPFLNAYLFWGLVGIYVLTAVIFQLIYYRSLELRFSENFLWKKHGIWNKREAKIEMYKIQSISVSQPYYYQKRNLHNLVFHTAGGDVSFPAVSDEVLPYVNYAFYKIESARKPWM